MIKCKVCDSKSLRQVIDLGDQPCCLHFLKKEEIGKEPYFPLRVVLCDNCQTSQLDYVISKEEMYSNHTYLSGITKSLDVHFKEVAQKVDNSFFKTKNKKSVLDIGSNDGTQLKHFKDLGYEIQGVEPSKMTAEIANNSGINTLRAFFNEETALKLDKKYDVINAAGVFFHLEELHSVTKGIKKSLKEKGVFVVQFLYMKSIMENLAFDQIYHEHLLYYNLKTIQKLLSRHGLEIFDAQLSPIHGGSIIGYVTHKGTFQHSKNLLHMYNEEEVSKCNTLDHYLKFAEKIKIMREENLQYLRNAKKEGKTIYGFGAPIKGNTMLNYFGIGTDLLDCLVEKNELRRNLYAPGSHIPIVLESEVKKLPDIYYVLAWNFKKEILTNNRNLIEKGLEFYFPVNPLLEMKNIGV